MFTLPKINTAASRYTPQPAVPNTEVPAEIAEDRFETYPRAISLDTLLSSKDHLKEHECRDMATRLLESLKTMHEDQHAMHRDINRDNVVFLVGHQTTETILTEFDTASSNPLTYRQIGTYYYMAPEVWCASPARPYSNKCDLWSVGALVYEALTGKPPFDAPSVEELRDKVMACTFQGRKLQFPKYPAVSAQAKDFVRQLLRSARCRPKVKDALEHPWITGQAEKPQLKLPSIQRDRRWR